MAHTNILLETGTNELEVIEFVITYLDRTGEAIKQPFGINVAKVREIIRMPEVTSLPNMPHCVKGVFNLRNFVIPVLDLSEWLYGDVNTATDRKLIVAEFNNLKFGFIVNDVYRIHRFSWKQVEAPDVIQDFSSESNSIIGIVKMEDRNILMLDVEKIIAEINPQLGMEHIEVDVKEMGRQYTIFTAEDSATIRRMILDRLQFAGFTIQSFNDGQAAWDALVNATERVRNGEKLSDIVHLVITDVEMPQMDGFTLTKNIKLHPVLSGLPVVVFSSLVSDDILHKGQSVGADAQLTKPQIGLLLDTVKELLEKNYH